MTSGCSRVPGATSAVTRVFDALWQRVAVRCRPGTVTGSGVWNGPGSALQRFTLQRVRDTRWVGRESMIPGTRKFSIAPMMDGTDCSGFAICCNDLAGVKNRVL